MVKFKDFSKPLSVFQVLFKANLIFKDFSRQSCIFKYFSSLCEPCVTTVKLMKFTCSLLELRQLKNYDMHLKNWNRMQNAADLGGILSM